MNLCYRNIVIYLLRGTGNSLDDLLESVSLPFFTNFVIPQHEYLGMYYLLIISLRDLILFWD